MSNSAQLLVHNIRAMQSPSIQGKEGWSETGFQKRNKWEHFKHHTHMHMYTHSMQQPPQANTTQHWHKAQVDATKCSEELQYQHESWWSNTTLTKKNKNQNKTKNKTWKLLGGGQEGRGIYPSRHNHPILDPRECTWISGACEIPGMLWWPACPTLVLFLVPRHQSVKIRLLPPTARKLEAYSQFKCLANHWTPV